MGGKSAATPPDYVGAAQATADSSEQVTNQQTYANRPTQTTPWGTTSYTTGSTIDPGTGQNVTTWDQNTSLNPELQTSLNNELDVQQGRTQTASGLLGQAQDEINAPVDWSQYQTMGSAVNPNTISAQPGIGSYADLEKQASDASYKQATSRLDPQWQQAQTDLQTQLANKGITEGSDAYTTAMNNQALAKNDAYQSAETAAETAGGTEAARGAATDLAAQQQQFQQGATASSQNFGQETTQQAQMTQERQQQISEDLQQRGFTLNQINALLSGEQVGMPSMPGVSTAAASAGTNYSGAATSQYMAAQDQANASNAAAQGTYSTLGTLGGIAAYAALA